MGRVSDDYWDKDEQDDRLYYAQEQKKHYHSPVPILRQLGRRIRKPRNFLILLGVSLLLLWRWRWQSQSSRRYWSRFAYSQYTTDTHSLCNSLMVFESLDRLKSQPDRVLLYPRAWGELSDEHIHWRMLHMAEQKYRVELIPVDLLNSENLHANPGTLDDPTSDWDLSLTKLRAFSLTRYQRVLHLDSDITLRQHLDELFNLPKAPIAMPRAYWTEQPKQLWPYTSLIMLIEPNKDELATMLEILRKWQTKENYSQLKKYDMDILNQRFELSTMTIPHRPYAMLSAEFRAHDHSAYMGHTDSSSKFKNDENDDWDADKALNEAKLVHFSDWPLPKPWIHWPNEGLVEMQPTCGGDFASRCREREIWKQLYEDFRQRRKRICKISPVPPPNWKEWKSSVGAG